MTDFDSLLSWCADEVHGGRIIEFPREVFASLSPDVAKILAESLAGEALIRLPEKDVRFFEWLRAADEPVWQDLWGGDNPNEPYVVSMAFLPLLLDPVRGFPICDLLDNDNYYFAPIHILDGDAEQFLSAIKERFLAKQRLTPAQLLALEISLAPIDVWRFAYHHEIPLDTAKKSVENLVADGILVHFRTAAELANFIEF